MYIFYNFLGYEKLWAFFTIVLSCQWQCQSPEPGQNASHAVLSESRRNQSSNSLVMLKKWHQDPKSQNSPHLDFRSFIDHQWVSTTWYSDTGIRLRSSAEWIHHRQALLCETSDVEMGPSRQCFGKHLQEMCHHKKCLPKSKKHIELVLFHVRVAFRESQVNIPFNIFNSIKRLGQLELGTSKKWFTWQFPQFPGLPWEGYGSGQTFVLRP